MTKKRTVWRLMAHHAHPLEALDWSVKEGRIAIGWGKIGSLESRSLPSPNAIARAIHEMYPDLVNWPFGGICLYDFSARIAKGDLVIVRGGGRSIVMEVGGDYRYASSGKLGDYEHQRDAKVRSDLNPRELWRKAGAKPIEGHNIRWALFELERKVDI